jgi:hypothetical protein
MGGGQSTPRYTERMALIQRVMLPFFDQYLKNPVDNLTECKPYCPPGINPFICAVLGAQKKLPVRCEQKPPMNRQKIKEYLYATYALMTCIPEHGDEAVQIVIWRSVVATMLPKLIELKSFEVDDTINKVIEKSVEYYTELLRGKGLDSNYATQADLVTYYNSTVYTLNAIDKKYINQLGALSKSMIAHTNKGELQYQGSLNLYNITYNFLINKLGAQFEKDGLLKGKINEADLENFLFFMNICVKIIEDKPLNQYNDGSQIFGIKKDSYDDAELEAFKLFDSLETLKGCCKLFLFLYRKKNCSKYIEMNNKLIPPYDIFRKCKVSGFEPINKPKEELERVDKKADSQKAGESTEITDENRARTKAAEQAAAEQQDKAEAKKESFTQNKEHFDPAKYGIFGEIYGNVKLIIGYIVVVIIITILLALSPYIYDGLYNIIANYLIPATIYILTIIAQMITVISKLFLMTAEGTVFFIMGVLSTIFGILQISTGLSVDVMKDMVFALAASLGITTTVTGNSAIGIISTTFGVLGKITYDMFVGGLFYLIDQFTNIFKVSEGSSFSLYTIVVNFLSLIFKILYDAGYGTFLLIHDIIMISVTTVAKGPGMFLGYTSNAVFNNSKKIYMNINNIDE